MLPQLILGSLSVHAICINIMCMKWDKIPKFIDSIFIGPFNACDSAFTDKEPETGNFVIHWHLNFVFFLKIERYSVDAS